ncbi:STE protein kinase [Puccinia sorghi]|uniref:STE protein kinase n=1 Tax=Puccinia sorghi TaxID=27349 RepID=A0A0L6UEZ1_9BASI|nr:STE protein kinase [Puccinia sorghi]
MGDGYRDPEARPTADRLTDHRFLEIDNKAWRFEDSELYRSIRTPH